MCVSVHHVAAMTIETAPGHYEQTEWCLGTPWTEQTRAGHVYFYPNTTNGLCIFRKGKLFAQNGLSSIVYDKSSPPFWCCGLEWGGRGDSAWVVGECACMHVQLHLHKRWTLLLAPHFHSSIPNGSSPDNGLRAWGSGTPGVWDPKWSNGFANQIQSVR